MATTVQRSRNHVQRLRFKDVAGVLLWKAESNSNISLGALIGMCHYLPLTICARIMVADHRCRCRHRRSPRSECSNDALEQPQVSSLLDRTRASVGKSQEQQCICTSQADFPVIYVSDAATMAISAVPGHDEILRLASVQIFRSVLPSSVHATLRLSAYHESDQLEQVRLGMCKLHKMP